MTQEAVPGMLRHKFQAKHADLPWDVVLSVDLFGTCKP